MWDMIGYSRVMRDLLLSQCMMNDFPLTFLWWLISFETRSRDIKKRWSWHKLLALFLILQQNLSFPQIKLTSILSLFNNDRILVNVVNILTTLDIIFVEPTFVPNYHFCDLPVTVKRGLLIHMTGWTEFCE